MSSALPGKSTSSENPRRKLNQYSHHCVLTGRTCIYLMQGTAKGSVVAPLIWWSFTIEEACREWQETGRPLFPIPDPPVTPSWHSMPLPDLKCLHQMVLVAAILELSNTREMCLCGVYFRRKFKFTPTNRFLALITNTGFSSWL